MSKKPHSDLRALLLLCGEARRWQPLRRGRARVCLVTALGIVCVAGGGGYSIGASLPSLFRHCLSVWRVAAWRPRKQQQGGGSAVAAAADSSDLKRSMGSRRGVKAWSGDDSLAK